MTKHWLSMIWGFEPTFWPDTLNNRMRDVGNLDKARARYFDTNNTNLRHLIEQRYSWMRTYLNQDDKAVEIGCGIGVTKSVLQLRSLELTDVSAAPWLDRVVDAQNLPYKDASVDAIIATNVIHHVPFPALFFRETVRTLKPGGVLLIVESQLSFVFRMILRLMHHEGWSYAVNPFDSKSMLRSKGDPWDGNNALSRLLFDDHKRFENYFPQLRIERDEPCEFLTFLLSGGVSAHLFTVNLPLWLLEIVAKFDTLLTRWLPTVFACSRILVIRKQKQ